MKGLPAEESSDVNIEKRRALEDALDQGLAYIVLDATVEGVDVPPKYAESETLPLNLHRRFTNADLVSNEWGVSATLSFEKKPYRVMVPWEALRLVASHATREYRAWPVGDVAAEIAALHLSGLRRKRHLRVVK